MEPARDAAGACLSWSPGDAAGPGDGSAEGVFMFEPSLPVLAGHFPGHPLVPGVHLLAAAARLLALARPATPSAPAAIERARWMRPVRPGEAVAVTVRWRVQGEGLIVDCAMAVDAQAAAQARLRYRA